MKERSFKKKLSLNKRTVVDFGNLSDNEMKNVAGGDIDVIKTVSCGSGCPSLCAMCIPDPVHTGANYTCECV